MKEKFGQWRGIWLLLFLFFLIFVLRSYAVQPVTLKVGLFSGSVWGVPAGDSYTVADAAIEAFERAHPNVRVKYVSGIQRSDYSEWLAEQVLKGEEPDVFLILPDDFALYASMGALVDLRPWIRTDGEFRPTAYYPAAYSYGQHGAAQMALPMESMPVLMFVNKTLLADEGIPMPDSDWTWQDFLAICRQVTRDRDGDGVLDQFGCYDLSWQQAAMTNGVVQLFREDGRSSYFASPRMEETVRFMMELHALEGGREVTAKDFDMGHVAFRPFTFAEYRTYKPYPWRIKKYSGFEWDCIKLPAGPSGNNQTFLGTLLAGISARTRPRDLAWEFLKTLCYDKGVQQLIVQKSQGLPARKDILDSEESGRVFRQDAGGEQMNLQVVSEVMAEAVEQPRFERQDVMLFADAELRKIINGTVPYNNALNKLQKEVNAYLQY